MEVELKLLLAPADVADFRRLPLPQQFAVNKPRAQKLSGTYFDNAGAASREARHGVAPATRRDSGPS